MTLKCALGHRTIVSKCCARSPPPPHAPEAHPSLGKVGAQEVGNRVGGVKWKPFWDEGKVLKIQKTESATGDLGLAP